MEGTFREIYDYLHSIDVLNEEEYKKLVSIYGDKLTNLVIEEMLETSENNLGKFDYYVNKVINELDNYTFKSLVDIYMHDIGMIPCLNRFDNEKYSKIAYDIVSKLHLLFNEIDCSYSNKSDVIFNSILDQVDFYLDNCDDAVITNEIKKLKSEFVNIRNILVEGNLRAVVAALKPYFRENKSILDYIQYGNIGLMKAVEKYNPNLNASFITYAYYWIKQTVRMTVRNEFNNATSISYRAIEENNFRIRVFNELINELGRYPTDQEVAERMGISMQKFKDINTAFIDSVSLFATIADCSGNGKKRFLIDTISDDNTSVEESVYLKALHDELMKSLNNCLSKNQIFILLNRYGFYGEALTFEQVGDMLNRTKQAICKREDRALAKVRRLEGHKLKEFL